MHRNTRLWGSDAGDFNPDRWLRPRPGERGEVVEIAEAKGGVGGIEEADGRDGRDAYAFLTFGGGVRRCIGEQYAKAELRTLLVALVGEFEFLPVEADDGDRAVRQGRTNGTTDKRKDTGQGEGGDHCAITLFKMVGGVKCRVRRVEAL